VPLSITIRYPSAPARTRVRVKRGALGALGAFARSASGASRVVLVTDPLVGRLYGVQALRSLARAGLRPARILVPRGERAKRPEQLKRLWRELSRLGLGREGAVVALGGGAVLDLAGFAAATWLRGVPWVGAPTTLLAQVDASIGGKTAVDLPSGKNMVGAFHQPAGVLADPETLATLPRRQRLAGLAEVVKTGFATDAALFRWTERNAERLASGAAGALETAVARSMRAKARVVARDEREREGGGRTALNFGHTLGHALEAALGLRGLLHGEAVAIGMRVAARLSERSAGLPAGDRVRLERLCDRIGLRRTLPGVPLARLVAAMASDKKRSGTAVRWVLTPRIGHASVPRSLEGRLVRAALLEAGARG
jgi:3-dehydroquinate synthase